MKRLMASGVLMVVLAAGCATAPPRPSVYASPTKRQPPDRIGQDMAQCESWAHQQTGFDPAAETAKGAVVGAVVGGALGAGGARRSVRRAVAAPGAVQRREPYSAESSAAWPAAPSSTRGPRRDSTAHTPHA